MKQKTKIEQIIEFLESEIAEYEGYTKNPEYKDIEQHDARVAAETCNDILKYINSIKD